MKKDDLDNRMKDAGMMSVKEMLECNSIGKFLATREVTNLDEFEKWIQCRRREFLTMLARMELDEDKGDMYEWALAHSAVLGEVMANFRQATGRREK